MTDRQTIEAEAESLEEAREQVKSQIPQGLQLLSEKIFSDGKPTTVKAAADTTEEAFAKAQNEVPANANVLGKEEIASPGQKVITVEAFDEQSARAQVESTLGDNDIIKAIKLKTQGKQGMLGIGKKPNHYEIEVFQQAVVVIRYKCKARISAEIGKKEIYDGPSVEDLTQDELLRELQRMGMSPGEADMTVQVAITAVSTCDVRQIVALYSSDIPTTADNLAIKWAAHTAYRMCLSASFLTKRR
jgi:hypothetical protein